jgi:hypothetical protein
MKSFAFLLCAVLAAAPAVPAAAQNRSALFERTMSEDREFRVQLTGDVSFFSFIPSTNGAFTVEVVHPERTAVYLVLLDERLERIASGRGPNESVQFDARKGSAYHIAITPVDGKRSRGATVTIRLVSPGVDYFSEAGK